MLIYNIYNSFCITLKAVCLIFNRYVNVAIDSLQIYKTIKITSGILIFGQIQSRLSCLHKTTLAKTVEKVVSKAQKTNSNFSFFVQSVTNFT